MKKLLKALFLFTMVATICPQPKVMNNTKTWTEVDKNTLNYAIDTGCAKQYKDSPCVKTFIKTEENTYMVVCTQMEQF